MTVREVIKYLKEDATLDFCRSCGASVPPRFGEGTCKQCDPEGVKNHVAKTSVERS